MTRAWSITPARVQDIPAIERLLLLNRLPTNDIEPHLAEFFVARAADRPVGAAGMERYPPYALLRSVVVDALWRRQGIARALTQHVMARARETGVERIYLLTETAPDCFRRLGFEPCARAHLPPELAQAPQVATLCCATAQAMTCSL